LAARTAELNSVLNRLDHGLPSNDQLRLVGEDLTISPVRGEDLPESAEQLQELVAARLPKLELADLLIEVDAWTHFSRRFEHAGGAEPRTKDLLTHLHAAIFAQACNFGLGQMAEIAELSYRKLAWCSTWYLREETLKAAIAQIVKHQHRLPLAQFWGGGTLSSSDGQRFPVPVKTRHATALPRYFGYRRGITHYTWTSDQYSPYGTKVIPSTVRDATYVLDEILDNETELPIEEHMTDTAGYAVMWTLSPRLAPRFATRCRTPRICGLKNMPQPYTLSTRGRHILGVPLEPNTCNGVVEDGAVLTAHIANQRDRSRPRPSSSATGPFV
jgi:hypothetical protein